ncbi:MAG TPA: hypothetical protein VGV36_02205, partial [Solirubrobacteraceae bacterium]|nr:hypothetical protein [Solirubrobacteraceae bacterium]
VLVGPSPKEQAAAVLRPDAADLAQLARATGEAGTVDELRALGRRAEDLRGELRARTVALGTIE